jgi:signal transduction histidine kinase
MAAPDAYPFPTLPAPLRFGIALAGVALVFLIDRSAGSLVDDGSHYLLLGTAVMATAWFAGTGPALAAVVLGAAGGALSGSQTADTRATGAHLAIFVVQGLLLTALIAELRRARRIAESTAREADEARRESDTASRMKDEFLRTISHELRTPLNAVLGWVHLLRTGKLDTATSTRGLECIDRNVRLQARLTSDLLDISKALTGRLRLDCRPLSLVSIARDVAASAVPAAQAKGVLVRTEFAEGAVPVLGDEARVRQIVWHLLTNAIKFTTRGGTVGLEVAASGADATLVISDSGSGIDPQFLPRVFDRFTQEDGSPTRTVGGLGVGLSLVRDLVELHGGEIQAENRAGGTGAVFRVRFPLQPADGLAAERPTAAVGQPSSSYVLLDGLRVVLLDRDPDAREVLRTVLLQRGADVRVAESVGDALEALEGWRPDILVSDHACPDADTYVLVAKVHSLEADRGGRIPAAALTASARADERLRRLLEPVRRDVPKPVEPALLASEIARLAGRERRRAERLH